MNIECKIENSRLILVFDDVRAYYIKGELNLNGQQFTVKKEDYWDRNDMSEEDKKEGVKAIDNYNLTNGFYILLDD